MLPLVEAYNRLKRSREVIDYGDQMALAARIAAKHAEVGEIERGRFAVVLLDEYQDTSHAQLVLLRALFGGGHPVTAVGDPCQSIYGWRGASAGNLTRFPQRLPDRRRRARRRSGGSRSASATATRVLDVAARRADPAARWRRREVPVLVPGGNRVERGRVVCAFHETAEDEADVDRRRRSPRCWAPRPHPTACRGARASARRPSRAPGAARSACSPTTWRSWPGSARSFPRCAGRWRSGAFRSRWSGWAACSTVPEVSDIVSTLRVLYDPTAGDALVRLLAGPRWRIGPADLKELGERARELNRETRDGASPAADPLDQVVADMAEERGSLIDALDELPDRPEWQDLFSPLARVRLVAMAQELRTLRAHTGQPLPDLILEIERRLNLDIEVAARGTASRRLRRPRGPGRLPGRRRPVRGRLRGSHAGRLPGVPEGRGRGGERPGRRAGGREQQRQADDHPRLQGPGVAGRRGARHVAGAVEGRDAHRRHASSRPARSTSPKWTENPRKLPYPLRGDASDLPGLAGLAKEELADFDERCRDRDLMEERRLAYVAVTRAHYLLIASGYRWGSAAKPLEPSDFLVETRETCGRVAFWAPEAEEGATNPLLAEPAEATWPVTPDGLRYGAVLDGATMVESALAALAGTVPVSLASPGTVSVVPRGVERPGRVPAWMRGRSFPGGPG